MTREELRDYVDEQRALNNIPYHVYSALIDGIDTLEQEPILDKIRKRVELEKLGYPPSAGYYQAIMKVLQIIDKYIEKPVPKYRVEQKPILDKIRTEIDNIEINGHVRDVECFNMGIRYALNIIDKYKAEVREEIK